MCAAAPLPDRVPASSASTNSPIPGEPSPSRNDGASMDQLAPDSPAASSSTISATFAPRAPPNGSSTPAIAAAGSVVALPPASRAQPSGMSSPRSAARRRFTYAVALLDWSMTSGGPSPRGTAKASGLVQNTGCRAPDAASSAGPPLVAARASSPWSASRCTNHPSPALV